MPLDIKFNWETLEDTIDSYATELSNAKNDLALKGKHLQEAIIEQASHLAYYDEIKVQLKFMVDYLEVKIATLRGTCWEELARVPRGHTDRAIDKLIDANPKYVELMKTFVQIEMLYNSAVGIVEQYKSRNYLLSNIVKMRIAALDDITL